METADALDLIIATLFPSQSGCGVSAATFESLQSDRIQKRSRNVVLPRS